MDKMQIGGGFLTVVKISQGKGSESSGSLELYHIVLVFVFNLNQ